MLGGRWLCTSVNVSLNPETRALQVRHEWHRISRGKGQGKNVHPGKGDNRDSGSSGGSGVGSGGENDGGTGGVGTSKGGNKGDENSGRIGTGSVGGTISKGGKGGENSGSIGTGSVGRNRGENGSIGTPGVGTKGGNMKGGEDTGNMLVHGKGGIAWLIQPVNPGHGKPQKILYLVSWGGSRPRPPLPMGIQTGLRALVHTGIPDWGFHVGPHRGGGRGPGAPRETGSSIFSAS